MPTLNIGGHQVRVDESFLQLSPADQSSTVDEIAGSLGFSSSSAPAQTPAPTAAPVAAAPAPSDGPMGPIDSRSWLTKQASDAGQAVSDISRLTANSAMFGYGDKLAALARGTTLAEERAKTAEAADRAGWAGTAAELAGGLGGAKTLLGKGLAASLPARFSGLGARVAASGIEGAGLGALSASGHDQDIGTGALVGGVLGTGGQAVAEGVTGAVGKVAGMFNAKPPDTAALQSLKNAAYDRSEAAQLTLAPKVVDDLALDVRADLARQAWHPTNQPKILPVLERLDEVAGQNVTLKGIDSIRQTAGNLRNDADPATRRLAGRIVSRVDDALDNLNATHIVGGNKTEGLSALKDARRLNSMYRKSEMVDEAMLRAQNNASATGTGGNIDNAYRQQFKSILNSPRKRRALTDDEQTAMQRVVDGARGQDLLRLVGRLSPTGNGLMAMLHGMGAVQTGGATIPLAGVGYVAKTAADRATPNNVYALARLIRSGGNKALVAQNAVQRLSQSEREALAQVLRVWGITQGSTALEGL